MVKLTLKTITEMIIEEKKKNVLENAIKVIKKRLRRLNRIAEREGFIYPCQELYDLFIADGGTLAERKRLRSTVRAVDSIAQTHAIKDDGTLYNPPTLPDKNKTDEFFKIIVFPISDNTVDISFLFAKVLDELRRLNFSYFTIRNSYQCRINRMHEELFLAGKTLYNKSDLKQLINRYRGKRNKGEMLRKDFIFRRKIVDMIFEIAQTGHYEWKYHKEERIPYDDELLEEFRCRFISELRSSGFKDSTVLGYDHALDIFLNYMNISTYLDLKAITPFKIQEFILNYLQQKTSKQLHQHIYHFRRILKFLKSSDILDTDHSWLILSPAIHVKHTVPYLDKNDESQILNELENATKRNKAMLLLCIRYALRQSDVVNLQFENIDWITDTITIKQFKTGGTVIFPLYADVGNAIMDYILNERPKLKNDTSYIFLREYAPYNKISDMSIFTHKIFQNADVKPVNGDSTGTHIFRYTLTRRMLEAKIPHQVITDTLGHKTSSSDKAYISMSDEMLKMCVLDLSVIGQKYWEDD